MFIEAAAAVADQVSAEQLKQGLLYPLQSNILEFSQLNDIASMNEIFPLEEAQAAYARMMSGKARFRFSRSTRRNV